MTDRAVRTGLWLLLSLAFAGCCCARAPTSCRTTATAPGRQIFVDMTTMRIPEARVDALLGALRPTASDESQVLSKEEAQRLAKTLRDDPDVQVIQAPKLLALDGNQATVTIGETVRFAKTEAKTNQEGGLEFSIPEDSKSPLFLGFELRLVPTASEDGKTIRIEAHALWREAEEGLTGATMDGVEFKHGAMFEDTLDVSFQMENDGHVLLGGRDRLQDKQGRHIRITLLHAVILAEPEAGKRTID